MRGRVFYSARRGDVGDIEVIAIVSTASGVVQLLLHFFCALLDLLDLGEAGRTLDFNLPGNRFTWSRDLVTFSAMKAIALSFLLFWSAFCFSSSVCAGLVGVVVVSRAFAWWERSSRMSRESHCWRHVP